MIDLAALERLLAEATPGRWRVDGSFDIYRDPNGAPDDNGDIVCRGYDHADARLIVAMHSALLELIAAARERDGWQRAAESQNRQWSQKCEALTEERARREELAAQLLATQQDRHRILMERDEMAAAARERDELRAKCDELWNGFQRSDGALADAGTVPTADRPADVADGIRALTTERDALRAEVERMRAVVEAARALVSWDWLWALPDGQIGDDARADAGHLEAALAALDAAKDSGGAL